MSANNRKTAGKRAADAQHKTNEVASAAAHKTTDERAVAAAASSDSAPPPLKKQKNEAPPAGKKASAAKPSTRYAIIQSDLKSGLSLVAIHQVEREYIEASYDTLLNRTAFLKEEGTEFLQQEENRRAALWIDYREWACDRNDLVRFYGVEFRGDGDIGAVVVSPSSVDAGKHPNQIVVERSLTDLASAQMRAVKMLATNPIDIKEIKEADRAHFTKYYGTDTYLSEKTDYETAVRLSTEYSDQFTAQFRAVPVLDTTNVSYATPKRIEPHEFTLRLAAERARYHSAIDRQFTNGREKCEERIAACPSGKLIVHVALLKFSNGAGKMALCHWSADSAKLLQKCHDSFVDLLMVTDGFLAFDLFYVNKLPAENECTPSLYDDICNLLMPMMLARTDKLSS
jgi:hypothetical protein